MTIRHQGNDLQLTIFFKCFLDYLRKGLIDLYATGGNGGSLSQSYWNTIPFPDFDTNKQKEIAQLYYNPESTYNSSRFTLNNFLDQDANFNEKAGIYELNKTANRLREILHNTIDDITNNREVHVSFNWLRA